MGLFLNSRSSDFGNSSPSQAIEVSSLGLFLHLIADSQGFDVNIRNCDKLQRDSFLFVLLYNSFIDI